MYATKQLSLFKRQPNVAPPEGRNCGYLVVKEDTTEGDEPEMCCWGTCPASEYERVWELPFPQNLALTVWYSDEEAESVLFVPVPDRPLASNRYYAVVAGGKRKGLVRACSRAEDMTTCFGCSCILKDAKPRPFDPADVYLQMEIVQRKRGQFTARSVAADGIAPAPYRCRSWQVYASPRKQMDRSPFYEAPGGGACAPARRRRIVEAYRPEAFIGGSVEAALDVGSSLQGGGAYAWFTAAAASGERIGVCTSVWGRMRWLERRRCGLVHEGEEEADDSAGKLMVRSLFVVKRMDGSIAMTFHFVCPSKVTAQQQRAC